MTSALTVARANGCQIPEVAWSCAQIAGIPFWAVCAFLEQETSGGANVFGHDPGWYSGAGAVTKAKYDAYKAGRAKHNAQGVGPMQLTWPAYQDEADAAGGCWLPRANVLTGCRILASFIAQGDTWHEAARRWNGSESYADQMDGKFARWQSLLKDTEAPMSDQLGYALVHYQGQFYDDGTPKVVTRRCLQVAQKLEQALGYNPDSLTIAQGCHHNGTLSANTHLRADVMDLSYSDYTRKAEALMKMGAIPFVRPAGWGGPGTAAHIHVVLRGRMFKPGQPGLDPQAYAQIADWDNHRNGLASHAPYNSGPWGKVGEFEYDPDWTRDGSGQQGQGQQGGDGGKFPLVRDLQISTGWANNRHRADRAALAKLESAHPDMKSLADAKAALDKAIPLVKQAHDALTSITGV